MNKEKFQCGSKAHSIEPMIISIVFLNIEVQCQLIEL